MKSDEKNRINIIKKGIYLLFIFMITFYVSLTLLAPDLSLQTFGFRFYVVRSNSMKPAFQKADVLVITKTNTNDLKTDDIIAVRKNNQMRIAHFVASQEISDQHELVLKTRPFNAENRLEWDYESFSRKQIIGKLALVIPFVGYLILYLQSPLGFIALIAWVVILKLLKDYYEKEGSVEIEE